MKFTHHPILTQPCYYESKNKPMMKEKARQEALAFSALLMEKLQKTDKKNRATEHELGTRNSTLSKNTGR